MEHLHPARNYVAASTETAKAPRCMQCGESLDAARMKQLPARVDKPMCTDCAYDALPCTD